MKVYNLACEEADHRFEGWFGSEQDFVEQQGRGLLSCPVCGSLQIKKLLSAPRLNLGAHGGPAQVEDQGQQEAPPQELSSSQHLLQVQQQAALLALARNVIANTEDVGHAFAEEARRMHYNESEKRGIRGVVSPEQRAELHEEGIEVMSLPIPDLLKETLQ